MKKRDKFQRPETRISEDGCSVFVTLKVNRDQFEFARALAGFHAGAHPNGTAEEQLETHLFFALHDAQMQAEWRPSAEIEALHPAVRADHSLDDEIPF